MSNGPVDTDVQTRQEEEKTNDETLVVFRVKKVQVPFFRRISPCLYRMSTALLPYFHKFQLSWDADVT